MLRLFLICLQRFKIHVERVCHRLTVPGFKYVVDPCIPVWQRSLFGLLMICITGITITYMVLAYNYSKTHYIVTNIESLQFPLWNLTYPAVYVCNLNRVSLKRLNQMLDGWVLPSNMTREEVLKEMQTLPAIAFKMKITSNYDAIYKILSLNNVSLITLMDKLSGPCSDLLKICQWWKREYDCDQLFSKTINVDGYCCSFNAYAYRSHQQKLYRKARIASSCSYADNLKVTVEINQTDYFSSLSSSYGIVVYLKNPYLYPDSSEIGKVIPLNMVTLISFLAKQMFSTDEVKELSDEYRGCVTTRQGFLAAFQIYSYHNCVIECRVNVTFQLCKCVPMIFPLTSGDQRRCEISDIPCLDKHSELLQGINHGIPIEEGGGKMELKKSVLHDKIYLKSGPCGCLPECSRTMYEADIAYSPLVQYNKFENRTVVYVYAQDVISTRIRRDTFYTWSVLLGTYGGLLGFFLGLSIICFSEIFYFFILHPAFVMLKTKLFNYHDNTNLTASNNLAVIPSMFVISSYEDVKLQTNVERYNNRLKRIILKQNTKMAFQRDWLY